VTPKDDRPFDTAELLEACRERLPAYMVPGRIDCRSGPLPRNPNGKIDRKQLRLEFEGAFNVVEST